MAFGVYADPEAITTCEEFERSAYFNPYDVVDSMWKIFYIWANTTEMYPIIFSLPAKNRIAKIKAMVEAVDPDLDVEWHKATLLMEPRPGLMVVFLYASTPGAFRALIKIEQRTKVRPHPLPLVKFADVRLKLLGRYMAMMCCEDLTAYALVRMDEMPTTEEECTMAASKLGIRLPGGHSYLHVKRMADEL
ncbi:uncharacterized protein LOC114354575 [Ostrinia furnacalis]|uniref:uncharacterized protein LOC114354575 n=1 Tax=Ostrinia furnacalis TaxID=93504 RepID=UPI001038E563|nr:uncharacterized protein LOC114354575 [Ostrinia furnacalis]